MHEWGDSWEHWKELYKAENYISNFVYRWSRCILCSKEKYGSIRYEWMFPPLGGVYYRYWYSKAWIHCWLYQKWALFGWWVCGIAIKKAIKKWPYLEEELCCDFMAPTKFGRQCRAKYWRSV